MKKDSNRLIITCPEWRYTCWVWIIEVVLGDWFGLAYEIRIHHEPYVKLELFERILVIDAQLLLIPENDWLTSSSLPKLPLATWSLPTILLLPNGYSDTLPILFGKSGFLIDSNGYGHLNVDVFGSLFFMLSRYEEVACKVTDQHDRYPGKSSHTYKAGLLERPLADEYAEMLWLAMNAIWPALERKSVVNRFVVSCDVDEPYERWIKGPMWLIKGLAGALGRRKSLSIAVRRVKNYFSSMDEDYSLDPNWTFDWYMELCERNNIQAIFYFIVTEGSRVVDGAYDINEPRLLKLLSSIHNRGHLIGLHGSYDTYRDSNKLLDERHRLQEACKRANVYQNIVHCRQHFLRWRPEITPDCLDSAGFQIDSSGGYADHAGFRFGTSREFRMWSWCKMRALAIKQSPLIVMEGTVLNNMGYTDYEDAYKYISQLKLISTTNSGGFVLLWHNSYLQNIAHRKLFESIVAS